jgi:microcystin-dependent protein
VAQARLGSGSGGAGLKVLHDDQTWKIAVPVGSGFIWYTNVAPTGYLLCDGSTVSRATYADLFALIGTTYNTGGEAGTDFRLPNLKQRFPLGKASAGTGNTLAGTGGTIDHVHSGPSHQHSISNQADHSHTIPNHSHGITGVTTTGPSGTTGVDTNFDGATTVVATPGHTHGTPNSNTDADGGGGATSSGGAHDHGALTGAGGTGNTGTANPPYLVVNYIIKY